MTTLSKKLITWLVDISELSYHGTKFDDYRSHGIGDIKLLFCHMKSRDHMIKGRRDLVNWRALN